MERLVSLLVWCREGMGVEKKGKKQKLFLVLKARAGWPKRLRLVQATP